MPPVVVAEFNIAIDVENFIEKFWLDKSWFEKFLIDQLCDLSVSVGDWSDAKVKSRNIRSFHPSKISFPGLPSHAESLKLQTLESFVNEKGSKHVIREVNTFRGIPYADYFSVNTEWTVTSSVSSMANDILPSSHVCVHLDFTFHKSTWLQGTIEANTKAELIGVYELWRDAANEWVKHWQANRASAALPTSDSMMDFNNDEKYSVSSTSHSRSLDNSQHSAYSDDEMFYDCEDGVGQDRQTMKARPHRNSSLTLENSAYFRSSGSISNMQQTHSYTIPITPPELHALYGEHPLSPSDKGHGEQPTNARDMAINIVEGVFVLAEFSYWKIYTVYTYDLKELFNVDPHKVVTRIRNSFLPGWHAPILLHPDIYGPLLAVFLLPQSLLLSMETSKHGCNPTSQLGNAVVVSLFIWLGLSCLYRLLSLLIAPTIGLKHCLSMTGYSFFSWNLALLCSFPLELYGDVLRIPMMLPLVVLGIPSSLALGCMFWEQTPASTMTLQPASLPTSIQQFATNNSRVLQRILWALPKIIAFVVVTGTHYQFLWYMARVFLPGRKQLCQLSALVQPSQYADILTQKELRKFAIALLLGKKDD